MESPLSDRRAAYTSSGFAVKMQEWRALAQSWIRESRTGTNANRRGLLDGPMLEARGDVRGLRVLDCGCGEGRFCRMLVDRGASYVLESM